MAYLARRRENHRDSYGRALICIFSDDGGVRCRARSQFSTSRGRFKSKGRVVPRESACPSEYSRRVLVRAEGIRGSWSHVREWLSRIDRIGHAKRDARADTGWIRSSVDIDTRVQQARSAKRTPSFAICQRVEATGNFSTISVRRFSLGALEIKVDRFARADGE